MVSYIISHELAQALMDYLTKKPFIEVVQLIAALKQIKPYEESLKVDDN